MNLKNVELSIKINNNQYKLNVEFLKKQNNSFETGVEFLIEAYNEIN